MTIATLQRLARGRIEIFDQMCRHPFDGDITPPRVAQGLGPAGVAILAPHLAARVGAGGALLKPRHELTRHPVGDLLVVSVGRIVRLQMTVFALDAEKMREAAHDGEDGALTARRFGDAGVRHAQRLWWRLPGDDLAVIRNVGATLPDGGCRWRRRATRSILRRWPAARSQQQRAKERAEQPPVDGHGTHSSAAPAAAKHFCPNSAEGVPDEASWATFRPVTTAQMPASGRPGTILLVDDEPEALRAFERMLRGVGYQVEAFTSAREAIKRVSAGGVHVVVSDISMPEMTGVELLRTIRAYDADLPVVLVTGLPAIDSATDAVEYGAFKYIVKPFEPEVLRSAVERARKLYRLARMKREALRLLGSNAISADRAGLEASFYSALDSMWMAFQPILRATDGSVYGFEALLRTEEPTLIRPDLVVDAAERLNVLPQLGRKVRQLAASAMSKAPPDTALFLNLHPLDLADEELFDELAPLTQLASRVILEVTERAAIEEVDAVERRVSQLRERGFRIAVDDLGAGYAGLSSFALLEPEIVKLDVSLLRDIDQSPVKQKLVASMTALCKDMGFLVVAEGIETPAERDCVVSLGCDLLQGFLFARPGRPFPTASWG